MKVIELLEFSREMLTKLNASGIRFDDCRFIELYHEYIKMRQKGDKVTYIVSLLADKHRISGRKVYDLVKRFGADCLQQDQE